MARARTGLRVTTGYLSDMDSSTRYDVVAAFDVLEHIADEAQVLPQMRERMLPEGRLILTVPAHQALWSPFDIASGHYRRYSMETLSRLSGHRAFSSSTSRTS